MHPLSKRRLFVTEEIDIAAASQLVYNFCLNQKLEMLYKSNKFEIVLRQELSFNWDMSLRTATGRTSGFREKRGNHIMKIVYVYSQVKFIATGIKKMSISSTERHQ